MYLPFSVKRRREKQSFFNCGIPVAGLEATNVDDVRGLVQGMTLDIPQGQVSRGISPAGKLGMSGPHEDLPTRWSGPPRLQRVPWPGCHGGPRLGCRESLRQASWKNMGVHYARRLPQ